jgi:hypothetical protein
VKVKVVYRPPLSNALKRTVGDENIFNIDDIISVCGNWKSPLIRQQIGKSPLIRCNYIPQQIIKPIQSSFEEDESMEMDN